MSEFLKWEDGPVSIVTGNALDVLRQMQDESVNCVVTSPPYWGLRDYGTAQWEGGDSACDHRVGGQVQDSKAPGAITTGQRPGVDSSICRKCGARRIDQQLGLERTPEEYIARMTAVFREVRRVLRGDGTLWLNIGDSYAGAGYSNHKNTGGAQRTDGGVQHHCTTSGCKSKDLVGIPWLLAFALRADGWYLRQDIIWCLSGGTWVYARTQKGDMPVMIRDLARLKPETVKLWNGKKWTRLLGISKSKRRGDEIEIVLRSGERISCTPTHRFPTNRGIIEASDIRRGDRLQSCRLPEPEHPKRCILDEDAAWLAGLYIAEGSRSGDTIQIAGHSKEDARWMRLCSITAKFGGSCTRTVAGNKMDVRLYGRILNAIIDELVTGRTAKDKGFSPVVWRYSDCFIRSMLDGYLSGDGGRDKRRWRLGFTRNYNLERDLRTACARLGFTLTLNLSSVEYLGRQVPTFRGEIREERSGHRNEKDRNEVMEIRKARCREVYDLGVEDEPHLFALASGILTHNSKPNPMPESVTDRCTKAHEYLFLLSKREKYYFDQEAILEPVSATTHARLSQDVQNQIGSLRANGDAKTNGNMKAVGRRSKAWDNDMGSNRTLVSGYGRKLAEPGKGTKNNESFDAAMAIMPDKRNKRSVWEVTTQPFSEAHFATFPEDLVKPCVLAGCPKGGLVLDPFCGSGTTLLVAEKLGCRGLGIELNPEYVEIAKRRLVNRTFCFPDEEVPA